MITVPTIELFLKAAQMLSDGQDFVELDILEGDKDFPKSLSLEANAAGDNMHETYDPIDECDESQSFTIKFNADSIAPISFSFDQLNTISQAYHNAIENCLTCLKDTNISSDLRSEITSGMKTFEKQSVALDNFLSDFLVRY